MLLWWSTVDLQSTRVAHNGLRGHWRSIEISWFDVGGWNSQKTRSWSTYYTSSILESLQVLSNMLCGSACDCKDFSQFALICRPGQRKKVLCDLGTTMSAPLYSASNKGDNKKFMSKCWGKKSTKNRPLKSHETFLSKNTTADKLRGRGIPSSACQVSKSPWQFCLTKPWQTWKQNKNTIRHKVIRKKQKKHQVINFVIRASVPWEASASKWRLQIDPRSQLGQSKHIEGDRNNSDLSTPNFQSHVVKASDAHRCHHPRSAAHILSKAWTVQAPPRDFAPSFAKSNGIP